MTDDWRASADKATPHERPGLRPAPLVLRHAVPMVSGLLRGTLVETEHGWQEIESLSPGQTVQTLDGGLARLRRLDRRRVAGGRHGALILLPGGVLDACSDLLIPPGQHLLIDTLDDPGLDGAPFALVPAQALLALKGPRRVHVDADFEVLTPLFTEEEVVYAQSGVLLFCPGLMEGAQGHPGSVFFPTLAGARARDFLRRRERRLSQA